MAKSVLSALALLMLATPALSACSGGHTFGTCADGITHWYDPDTGEICDPLDCGGGRAPPKTDVPGCAGYEGTSTLLTDPSYMPCFTSGSLSSSLPASPTVETTTSNEATSSPTASTSSNTAEETQIKSTTSGASSTAASSSSDTKSSAVTGSESTAQTTAPPTTTPADTSTGAGDGAASSSTLSTTAQPGAGSIVGRSWMAVVAGVALGAVAVI